METASAELTNSKLDAELSSQGASSAPNGKGVGSGSDHSANDVEVKASSKADAVLGCPRVRTVSEAVSWAETRGKLQLPALTGIGAGTLSGADTACGCSVVSAVTAEADAIAAGAAFGLGSTRHFSKRDVSLPKAITCSRL